MTQANRVYVKTETKGQGTVTLGAVVSQAFCTFAEAGVTNGASIESYIIEAGQDFEIGVGIYNAGTLTRDTVRLSRINGVVGTSKMTLIGNATVRSIVAAEDLATFSTQSALNERGLSVKLYGAAGSGLVDDTAKVQAAFDAAGSAIGNKLVWFPAGTYLTSAPIVVPAGVSFAGAGPTASIVWGNHSGRTFSFEDIDTTGMFVRDLRIKGNNTSGSGFGNGTSTGVYFATTVEQSAHFSMTNVKISGHGKGWDAVDTYGMFDSVLDKIDFIQCATWGYHWTGSENKHRGITTRLCAVGTNIGAVSAGSIAGGIYDGTCIGNGVDFDFTASNVRKMTINVWCEQTVTTSFRNSSGGTLNFIDFVLDQPLFQPAATATGTGTFDVGTITGNVDIRSPLVYKSNYTSATISKPTISGATSRFTMRGAVLIDNTGVRTQLPDDCAVYDTGYRIGRVLLASGTVSSAATLDLVLTSYTAYRGIEIELISMIPVTDAVSLLMRMSTDGGASYDSAAASYSWVARRDSDVPASAVGTSNSDTSIAIATSGGGIGNGTMEGYTGTIKIVDQTNAALWGRISHFGEYVDSVSSLVTTNGSGMRKAAQDTDALRFLFSSGNIASGKYAVYGLQ